MNGETAFEQMQRSKDECTLMQNVEWFVKTYAPTHDVDARARFDADLFMLVRRIYQDAQAPLIKQMTAAMALQSKALILRDAPATTSGKSTTAEGTI